MNKILFQGGNVKVKFRLGETGPGQSTLEADFRKIRTAIPEIQEQVQDSVGKPSPGHHGPAKILLFRGKAGGPG